MKPTYELGIDIGGTFTDLTLRQQNGSAVYNIKTPTVPEDPAQGIVNGLQLLKEKGIDLSSITYFVHGMTIGLNTLLQKNGAKLGMIVTEGFRDMLSIQRLRLPVPYDFKSTLPESLIERKYVYPVKERMQADGEIHTALDLAELDAAIDEAVAAGVDGLVVSFLHSYRNPEHEQKAVAHIKARAPHLYVAASSSIWTQMREYERTVIAAMNVFIQPNVQTYFDTLVDRLKEEGMPAQPFITQSNGGLMEIHTAGEQPVRTLFSGPAAGVMGALQAAKSAGTSNVMTFDVGGTSADISIIENGEILYSQANELAGLPTILPSVAIYSIGAGGGSIAWIDKGGILKVGPESAGSSPGPACYGRGERPALTDAFLLAGYLNSDAFAGGNVQLDSSRSYHAFESIAAHLNTDVVTAADQTIQVAVANMFTELSNVLEQQGIDPKDFSLLAFGGAGPVLANALAEEIQAKDVLIPPSPGNLCALGSLAANFIYDAVTSRQTLISDLTTDEVQTIYAGLQTEAQDWLDKQQVDAFITARHLQYSVDARYQGQAFEIELPFSMEWLEGQDLHAAENAFHEAHQRQYGHHDRNSEIEITTFKVRIIGETPEDAAEQTAVSTGEASYTERKVRIQGKELDARVYQRNQLGSGTKVSGPAIVEQQDTTVVILPGWSGAADAAGNLILEREEA